MTDPAFFAQVWFALCALGAAATVWLVVAVPGRAEPCLPQDGARH